MVSVNVKNALGETRGRSKIKIMLLVSVVLGGFVLDTLNRDGGFIKILRASSTGGGLHDLQMDIGVPIIEKAKGLTWEVWNRTDPLFRFSKFAECDWVKFRPVFPDTLLSKSVNETASSMHDICVHKEQDIVSQSIRRHGTWGDCNALSVMWDEYMGIKTRAVGEEQQPEYHFEIGANIGACMMQILLTTPDYVHVVAFEPNPKNLFCLTTTLMRLPLDLRRRVILFPVALGAEMARSTINMAVGNYGHSVVSKVILVEEKQQFLEPIPIQVEVMDDLIDSSEEQAFQVGVMKMDIQGYECNAMRGMHGLLARTYQIKFESDNRLLGVFDNCSSNMLFSQMRDSGFGIYTDRAESTKPLLGDAPAEIADFFAMKKNETTSSPPPETCDCNYPGKWSAQSGQDKFLFERIFEQQSLCCKGVFVEFGARNGIEHSNTYALETYMGWTGLMFELDPNEYQKLEQNRPGASIVKGAVCPAGLKEINVLLSTISGHSGALDHYEEKRLINEREKSVIKCYNLAEELRTRDMHTVDYMTIDTEGSEVEIVLDFPWEDFDIRVVQIEQLVAAKYPSQAGKKEKVIEHMLSHGYELFHVYVVAHQDTDDLMFTRNLPLNVTSTSR